MKYNFGLGAMNSLRKNISVIQQQQEERGEGCIMYCRKAARGKKKRVCSGLNAEVGAGGGGGGRVGRSLEGEGIRKCQKNQRGER